MRTTAARIGAVIRTNGGVSRKICKKDGRLLVIGAASFKIRSRMSKTDTEKFSYEEAYGQLQEIVSRLEDDEPSLDELVKDYERGMKLLKTCHKRLNEAALRIEKVREDEEMSLEPFDAESTLEGK
tara:strand:- start:56 stop:433 length:378 start_codon:yes stop_codon:yes gene_type:complete